MFKIVSKKKNKTKKLKNKLFNYKFNKNNKW